MIEENIPNSLSLAVLEVWSEYYLFCHTCIGLRKNIKNLRTIIWSYQESCSIKWWKELNLLLLAELDGVLDIFSNFFKLFIESTNNAKKILMQW